MTGPDAACSRPGCPGTIDDGYCDTCGLAVGPAVVAAPGTAAAVGAGQPPRTGGPSFGPATARGAPLTASGSRRFSRRASRRTGSSARSRIGAGLVEVPPVPATDPASALLKDPQVAEEKRFCATCGEKVGRAFGDRPGRVEGFCPRDGTRFSFAPKLGPGDLVAGQYAVQGCLAHGGLGWIYLALDRNVEDRWVVLKGLVNAGDADAMAAAIAERRFLAQVNHPNIVTIHNFVQHPGDDGTPVGYIVMEYVGGSSLKQLLEARRRPGRALEPLPLPQAIAYALEILPALGHLHSLGLAYCDFKPENVIQYERRLKLIDLGAVIRMDDERSAIFGTIGYQAPEIATDGPSAASDVYTVGRTLAVLALGMPPTRGGVAVELPGRTEHPVLRDHESFDRVLRRATHPDPLHRFASADEMADQLAGVLREVLSISDGEPRPAPSTVFSPSRGEFAPDLLIRPDGAVRHQAGRPDPARIAAALPVPLVDMADAAAGLLATATAVAPQEVARLLAAAPEPSPELRLRLVRAHLEAHEPAAATAVLDELAAEDPDDWRLDWFRGIAALVAGAAADAAGWFDACYTALPGEATVKLALAAAAECAGRDEPAGQTYALLARTDPGRADAVFGLARVRLRTGDRAGAVQALESVPDSSSRHVAAQLGAVQAVLLDHGSATEESELRVAAARVERLPLDPDTDQQVRSTLLAAAVAVAGNGVPTSHDGPFLGTTWGERELRLALESCLRTRARLASDPDVRIALVDRANATRPRTWL